MKSFEQHLAEATAHFDLYWPRTREMLDPDTKRIVCEIAAKLALDIEARFEAMLQTPNQFLVDIVNQKLREHAKDDPWDGEPR